jgi:hypothetical protein
VERKGDIDSKQYELFRLQGGTAVLGNLKHNEKPTLNNIGIFVKEVFVVDKNLDYKVDGWINCNQIDLRLSLRWKLRLWYLDYRVRLLVIAAACCNIQNKAIPITKHFH